MGWRSRDVGREPRRHYGRTWSIPKIFAPFRDFTTQMNTYGWLMIVLENGTGLSRRWIQYCSCSRWAKVPEEKRSEDDGRLGRGEVGREEVRKRVMECLLCYCDFCHRWWFSLVCFLWKSWAAWLVCHHFLFMGQLSLDFAIHKFIPYFKIHTRTGREREQEKELSGGKQW